MGIMTNIFVNNILNTTLQIKPNQIGDNIDDILLDKLKKKVEGKCDRNGYIRHDSVKILKRSMGHIIQGNFNGSCNFRINYLVDICRPVEGMIIKGIIRNLNKMGLFCEVHDIEPSPLSIILAKQHHLNDSDFEKKKLDDVINIEIIGIKFNYNDNQISCIGRLSNNSKTLESTMDDNEDNDVDEISLKDDKEDNDEDNDEDNEEEEDNEEDNDDKDQNNTDSLSNSNDKKGGEKVDIISMIGGSVNNNLDNEEESSMLVQDLDLDLEDDIVFKGEPLDLELISREKTSPIYLNENYEIPEKITQEIFSTEIKTNQNYKPFIT